MSDVIECPRFQLVRGRQVYAMRALAIAILAVGWIGATTSPAVAVPQPWEENVTEEQKDKAKKLYEAGNKHLEMAEFELALALYKSAIAEWDHPKIRYNMAVCLGKLNRPVEAYESLLSALRYGADPLGSRWYALALQHKRALEKTVTSLEVVCDEPSAQVTLNGRPLFTGPGKMQLWVLSGEHQVVGQRPDRRTISESIEALPGRDNRVVLASWPIETKRVLESRWESWKPWVVTGAGAFVLMSGLPLEWRARSNMNAFDQQVDTCDFNPEDNLCPIPPAMLALYDRSRLQNRMAIAAFGVGGALLVTGLTLVILNRPRERTVPRIVVTPTVSEDRALVTGTLRF